MNTLTDRIELLQLESSLILEESEEGGAMGTVKGWISKAAAWFKKMFNMIKDALLNLRNKVLARIVNLQKAFAKRSKGADGNLELKFRGAEIVRKSNITKLESVLGNYNTSIQNSTSKEDLNKLESIEDEIEAVIGSKETQKKKNKEQGVMSVSNLGKSIDAIVELRKTFKDLTNGAKERENKAKIALAGAEKDDTAEAKKKVELEKAKTSKLKKAIGLTTKVINSMAVAAVAGISAIGSAKKNSKKDDKEDDKTVEESFDFFDFDDGTEVAAENVSFDDFMEESTIDEDNLDLALERLFY